MPLRATSAGDSPGKSCESQLAAASHFRHTGMEEMSSWTNHLDTVITAKLSRGDPRMQRSLYRVYLYGIIVILLYFVSIATTVFLAVLLRDTPLNGTSPTPITGSDLVQPAVFAITSWIITLSVGGLHYWLLRRNEAGDALGSR